MFFFTPSAGISTPWGGGGGTTKQVYWMQLARSMAPCSVTGSLPITKIACEHLEADISATILRPDLSPDLNRNESWRISIYPTRCTLSWDQYWLFLSRAVKMHFRRRLPVIYGSLNTTRTLSFFYPQATTKLYNVSTGKCTICILRGSVFLVWSTTQFMLFPCYLAESFFQREGFLFIRK